METLDDGVARPISEVCRRKGVGKTTLYAEIGAGRLEAHRFCGRTLITDANEQKWWESYAQPILPKRSTEPK